MTHKDKALKLALEALEFAQKGTLGWTVFIPGAITAIKQDRALDKKAENARELGLDYEPVQQEPVPRKEIYGDSDRYGTGGSYAAGGCYGPAAFTDGGHDGY